MIQELVNYSRWLKKDFPELWKGIIHKGLHIEVSLDDNGKLKKEGFKFEIYRENQIDSVFLLNLVEYENKGEMIPIYIIKNKYVDSSGKFFSSNNYYSYFFKIFRSDKKDLKISNVFSLKRNKLELKNNDYEENFKNFICSFREIFFNKKLDTHYKFLQHGDENDFKLISKYLKQHFWNNFIEHKVIEKFLSTNKSGNFELTEENKKLLSSPIHLTFKTNNRTKKFDENVERYYLQKLPLKQTKDKEKNKKFVIEVKNKGIYLFNPLLSQDNDRKPYSRHLSHFSLINSKYEKNDILDTMNLLKLIYYEKLPKPLPIFLDKKELNKKVVTLYRQNNQKKTYTQIITSLCRNHQEDLDNYYLINYSKRKSLIINDVDFVSSFKFWINKAVNPQLYSYFFDKHWNKEINHIFDVEKIIKRLYFFNELSYFGDLNFTNDYPAFMKNNVYKYRKRLYDVFFKSRLYLITPHIFKDICMPVIRYEISRDETDSKGYSKNEYRIKKKLLLYIQLNQIFDKGNINFGGIDMSTKLPELYENLKNLLHDNSRNYNNDESKYQSDEEFAFSTGQLIRYLLEQSESKNKNHSMFNPFLQKLGDFDFFIAQINRTLKTYAHKIKMNYDTFDKIMSNTTNYKLEKPLKELETSLISGYFAKSAINEVLSARENEKKNKQNHSKGDKNGQS